MRPAADEVLHFSQDPTITRFVPHVAATAKETEAYVWAVGADRAPDYWFPRDTPRAMAWVVPGTTDADRDRIIGAGAGRRVHAVEYGALEAMRTVELYGYRLPAAPFRSIGHALVATEPVEPLGPAERVGDLFALHEAAGIQLRVLPDLWPFWDEVVGSTLGYSGIRLRYARPAAPPGDRARSR
ncbi:DUF6886 family protein [Asanoa siamensis]|uniref:Uncharacterized protein n=1 Tax=Asanoa siamensis TaxID=926357 RepID=A0ABQ4D2D9_9ACTN|nr:DUF6886 family protein [Asanoa siamensis]GIF77702.1 hypothetical protein Asi02nite_72200 [Asanoa siamensis]